MKLFRAVLQHLAVRLTYDASQVHSAYSEATRGVKELRPERRMPKIKPHGSTSLQNAIIAVFVN